MEAETSPENEGCSQRGTTRSETESLFLLTLMHEKHESVPATEKHGDKMQQDLNLG